MSFTRRCGGVYKPWAARARGDGEFVTPRRRFTGGRQLGEEHHSGSGARSAVGGVVGVVGGGRRGRGRVPGRWERARGGRPLVERDGRLPLEDGGELGHGRDAGRRGDGAAGWDPG